MDNKLILHCTDASPDFNGILDFSIAPQLLYYAYLPIIFVALVVGFFVLIKDKFSIQSKILFCISVFFSLFIFNELIQWIAIPIGIVYFGWSLGLLLNFLIVLSTFYFVYVFVKKQDLSLRLRVLLSIITFPVILFLPTKLNLVSFDPNWCGALTGPLWYYLYLTEITTAIILLSWGIQLLLRYRRDKQSELLPSIYLLFGSSIFLVIFFLSYFFADYTGIYEINLIGPLGMLVFILTLTYLTVRFKSFDIGLVASQTLVAVLIVLVGSQFTFINTRSGVILTAVTLVLTGFIGIILIRSVLKEVKQRKEIETLVIKLEQANVRLKQVDKLKSEFVTIASHQLRSPITAISGYASLMREGSYGELNARMREPVERIEQSARMMAISIEDYLNVSRIESGYMKYNNTDFNLPEQTEHICDDLRSEALKRGLILLFKKKIESQGIVNADIGKIQQIIHNLINNSIKYTPKGAITVYVHDIKKAKRIYIDIMDTGIGMNEETLKSIFQKFERGDKANTVNVKGTGLGLYVALKMSEAMGGNIIAHSEGEGKGSRFTIELPLAM